MLPWRWVALMLSIGKLAAGQERYYEQQVAKGLDDYFTGRGESPGRWLGRGAADLGLEGKVEDGQLSALMAGRDPKTGEMLREQDVKVAALDLTFSAPKSISVLYAVANERVSAELVVCHEQAVEAALSYLEDTAVLVSRRTGGALSLHQGGGFVTAAFRHRMSRALDPQLHTHCVSANLAKGNDGRWTALHHPTIFRAAQTAGYLYQAQLRALVHERLGLEWGPVHKGAADLQAIDRTVLEEFSKRRHEMRRAAQADGIGLGSRSASQAAALATRTRKQFGIETGTWREDVRARAGKHGLDRAERRRIERDALKALEKALDRDGHSERAETVAKVDARAEGTLGDRLAGARGLTEMQNTFDQRAVLRALAEDAQQGERIDVLRGQGGRFTERHDVLRTEHGELTTAELVAVERRLIAAAQGRAGEGVGRVDADIVARALADCGRAVNEGQQKAAEATVSSGHGVQVIEALAGTGKTYTAGVLRHVYQSGGYEVIGVAPTGRAVRELAEEAGIPSRTLDALVGSIERGYQLPAGSVVVLDEAGMAPTRKTAALLEAAQAAGCKVIAIGDPGQLHSVQAGGWMRAVGRKVGTLRLSEVMRQRDPLERRALAALHDGASGRWLGWAREQDRVVLGSAGGLLERAVSEWHEAASAHGAGAAVLIARDNDTRQALNDRARELVREHGGLGAETSYGPVQVAAGDRVICRMNDRLVDVDNGTCGTVRAVDDAGAILETGAGTMRRLPAAYVAAHVEHAYALTGHGMQGGTVERAFVIAAPHELTCGWSYTALSRARGETRLFVITDNQERDRDELAPGERQPKPTKKELYAQLGRYMQTRDDEDLAIEQLPLPPTPGRAPDPELDHVAGEPELQEASAARAEPATLVPASVPAFTTARARVGGLRAQLEALATPEIKRLDAAERRERELIAHENELLARARKVRPAPRLPLAADRHAQERENIERAIAGARAEVHAIRTLRDRLVQEVGQPAEIRAERAGLQTALAQATGERDRLRDKLVTSEIASEPTWSVQALGERPSARAEQRLWDRAARGLARYRLEHGITDERSALGELPTDPVSAERFEQARSTLERVRHELGVHARSSEDIAPLGLPSEYLRLFGPERASRLEAALASDHRRARTLSDEELRGLTADERGPLASLDRHGAGHVLRLEQEHAHHVHTARDQTARAEQLNAEADQLGRRDRHQRDHLRQNAAMQCEHAGRHLADAERIELELDRLTATGRHPDQWLEQNADALVAQVAARSELAQRHERDIDRQAELAITHPPDHVRGLIGERPVSGVRLAQEWEQLADRIERHRLAHDIDVDRDGPLGPDPSQIPAARRPRYEHDRETLAGQIDQFRGQRGLAPPVSELARGGDQREEDLGLEL
jgi:conjugative relaxase-like TrwC/TraI family protein